MKNPYPPSPRLSGMLMVAGLVILLAVGITTLVACSAEADPPKRTIGQAKAMICYEAAFSLKNDQLNHLDAAYESSYAYLVAFYEAECGR